MNFFNPGSPKFRRGVFLLSVYSCSLVGMYLIMADYGSHEHVFTPIQAYINKKVDNYFHITSEELHSNKTLPHESSEKKGIISLRVVDKNDNEKSQKNS